MNGLSVGSDSSEATTETTVASPVATVSAAVAVVSWPRAIFSGTPPCDSTPPGSMSRTPPLFTNMRAAPCSMPTLTFCELDCAVIAALLLTYEVERARQRGRARETSDRRIRRRPHQRQRHPEAGQKHVAGVVSQGNRDALVAFAARPEAELEHLVV